MSIEHMNYWGDERVQAAIKNKEEYEEVDGKIFFVLGSEEDENKILLPCKLEECVLCDGTGTHVNPSIDAGGLGREDFDEDPGFEEDYFNGTYDVTCYGCKGVLKVLVVDYNSLDDAAKKRWDSHCREEAAYQAECDAERRMGA